MKNLMSVFTAVLLFTGYAVAGGTGIAKTVYTVEPKESRVLWTGEKVTGEHTGTIGLVAGSVMMSGATITHVSVRMDMNSIVNTDIEDPSWNQKLTSHLKSDDFFSVDKYPQAAFAATGFRPVSGALAGEDNYTVTGYLTIKGITHPISFPARITASGGRLTANGKVVFDRTLWNIRYGSGSFFEGLGDKMIYDNIEIKFSLVAFAKTDI